jgi:hypothetical protein
MSKGSSLIRGKDSISRLEVILRDHERRIKILEQQLAAEPEPVPVMVEVARPAVEAVVAAPTPPPAPAKQTVRGFVLEKGPSDDVQRCVVIGYFLEKRDELKSFNAKDIEKGFVDSREKVPGNVADKILKNVWKGHMMQVPEEKDGLKAYVLTNAGIKFVESGLSQA